MTSFLQNQGHTILLAFWMTLKVSALSAAASLVVGTVLAAMRVAPLPVLRAVGSFYVNTLRNTPLTLIILFCGFGLSFAQTMRIIVLPQAFRAVIGPLGSVLIALIKNTTIAAAIGVPEAFYTMRNELQSYGDIVVPIFAGYALFFIVITMPTGLIFGWMAKRWPVAR